MYIDQRIQEAKALALEKQEAEKKAAKRAEAAYPRALLCVWVWGCVSWQ